MTLVLIQVCPIGLQRLEIEDDTKEAVVGTVLVTMFGIIHTHLIKDILVMFTGSFALVPQTH